MAINDSNPIQVKKNKNNKEISSMNGLRSKFWDYLRELEEEMKKWVTGVELEVVDIIREAGYEVFFFK